jgi:hypothetical protein
MSQPEEKSKKESKNDKSHHIQNQFKHHHHLAILLQKPGTLHLLRTPQHKHELTRPRHHSLQLLLTHVMNNSSAVAGLIVTQTARDTIHTCPSEW